MQYNRITRRIIRVFFFRPTYWPTLVSALPTYLHGLGNGLAHFGLELQQAALRLDVDAHAGERDVLVGAALHRTPHPVHTNVVVQKLGPEHHVELRLRVGRHKALRRGDVEVRRQRLR
eukprot:805874-Pyramimonas_sp.AAC.1